MLSAEVPDISITELLNQDLRPSLLVDLQPPHRIILKNPRFTTKYDFENRDAGCHDLEQDAFSNWVYDSRSGWESDASISYCGSTWVATTLRGRWRLVQSTIVVTRATQFEASFDGRKGSVASLSKTLSSRLSSRSVEEHDMQLQSFHESARNHDWTSSNPSDNLSPHVQLLRSWDWSKTPLGPMESWPPLLVSMANILMVDPRPVCQQKFAFTVLYQY